MMTMQIDEQVINSAPPRPRSIASRIIEARANVGAVGFEGRNEAQKFSFMKWTDVLFACRKALGDAGLDFDPEVVTVELKPQDKGNKAVLHFNMHLHSVDGETRTRSWWAESNDFSDKAVNKAITFGVKTYLLRLLLITDIEDSATADSQKDDDTDKRSVPTTPKRQPQQAAQQAAKPVSPEPATYAVSKAIIDVGKKAKDKFNGNTEATIQPILKEKFNVTSFRQLTDKQAAELSALIDEMQVQL